MGRQGEAGYARRGRQFVLALGVLIAAFALAASAALSADQSNDWAGGPSPASVNDPSYQQAVSEGVAESEQSQAALDTPAQQQAREDSTDAYAGLDAAEAHAIAAESFPELILEPSWEPPF